MKVIKRNGNIEDFDIEKIINAVIKAYESQSLKVPNCSEVLKEIRYIFSKDISIPIGVEDIQNRV